MNHLDKLKVTFQGNFDPNKDYYAGDFVYFPSEQISRVFDGSYWQSPENITELQMPPPLSDQEILRLRELLQEKFPEDYI